jgi:hypothetical protein
LSDLAVKKFDTSIGMSLSSKSFDHKKITLDIGKKTPKNFNKIDDSILRDDETDIVLRSTIFESYLVHADDEIFPWYRKNELLLEIGRINYKLKEHYNRKKNDEQYNDFLLDEARAVLETLPDPEFFLTYLFHAVTISSSKV